MTNEIKTIEPQTIDSSSNIKWTEKIETIYPETIESPTYDYGNSQNTLDYNIALRNKPSGWLYAIIEAWGTQSIPNNTTTTITGLSTKSGNSAMTATSNQITITEAWAYLLSAYCFIWWTSWNIQFRIRKNGTSITPHYRVNPPSSSWTTPFINTIENLVVWDILTIILFQDSGSSQTLQNARLWVSKI